MTRWPAIVACALAGAWASPAAERWQVFVQRLDAGGAPEGDLVEPYPEPGVTQSWPAVVARADGGLLLAWTRAEDDGPDRVVHGGIALGASTIEPSPPPFADPASTSAGAALAGDLLAFQAGDPPDVFVRPAVPGDPAGAVQVGAAGKADHSPAIAALPGGVAVVAWYRVRSGLRNDLFVQRVRVDGIVEPLPATLVNPPAAGDDHAAAPYAPALAATGDGATVFLAWSEGKSPKFRLKGRFLAP